MSGERHVLTLLDDVGDVSLINEVLERHGMASSPCSDASTLMLEMERGAAVAVVDESRIGEESHAPLQRWLAAQPAWADFPFIVLAEEVGSTTRPVHPLVEVLGNASENDTIEAARELLATPQLQSPPGPGTGGVRF